ncbi:hypothetical protein TrST_g307 [Triparma strigata]|uniref:Ion transport domain-containing protein n=1 Tax=Triparma strigata TaxID=1606541 RepID=A0A9W7DPN2_9STRA|nr:hypothetical protein TrST_g307 [Triparma strigata]
MLVFAVSLTVLKVIEISEIDLIVQMSVVATMLLTFQWIAFCRGLKRTGWLVAVLSRNFLDTRGFTFILLLIIVGMSVTFTALLGRGNPQQFGSFSDSIFSTFAMALTMTFEIDDIYSSPNPKLTKVTFMILVFVVTIISLNALIAFLGDSYQRIQESSTANMRKMRAMIVLEYIELMPVYKRLEVEKNSKFFHKLQPVDELQARTLEDNEWQGQIKAIKTSTRTIINELRNDLEKKFVEQNEVISELKEQNAAMKDILGSIHGLLEGDGGKTSEGEKEDEVEESKDIYKRKLKREGGGRGRGLGEEGGRGQGR